MPERQIIFVLGMGRSGTSAMTRVLSLCGAHLPGPLLGASESNPTGHWEPIDVININNAFLSRHGASWYDPTLRLQGEIAFSAQEKETYVEKIREFIERSPAPLMVIKEPRIVAVAGFWFEASRRASVAAKVVIPIRHPDEVSASLAARDGISPELSTILWLKYNLLAERNSRQLPRVFVEYGNFLNDWRKEIDRISRQLTVDLSGADQAAIDGFLDPKLYHQKLRRAPNDNILDQIWSFDTYTALSAAAHHKPLNLQKLDTLFLAFSACERAFRHASEEFQRRDLDPFL